MSINAFNIQPHATSAIRDGLGPSCWNNATSCSLFSSKPSSASTSGAHRMHPKLSVNDLLRLVDCSPSKRRLLGARSRLLTSLLLTWQNRRRIFSASPRQPDPRTCPSSSTSCRMGCFLTKLLATIWHLAMGGFYSWICIWRTNIWRGNKIILQSTMQIYIHTQRLN